MIDIRSILRINGKPVVNGVKAREGYSMRAARKTVTYRVIGNASLGLITYLDRFGKAAQLIADLPWSSSFQIESGKTLFLEARPVSFNGTFKCEIMVDGKAVESSPLSDGFISVRCETRLLQ